MEKSRLKLKDCQWSKSAEKNTPVDNQIFEEDEPQNKLKSYQFSLTKEKIAALGTSQLGSESFQLRRSTEKDTPTDCRVIEDEPRNKPEAYGSDLAKREIAAVEMNLLESKCSVVRRGAEKSNQVAKDLVIQEEDKPQINFKMHKSSPINEISALGASWLELESIRSKRPAESSMPAEGFVIQGEPQNKSNTAKHKFVVVETSSLEPKACPLRRFIEPADYFVIEAEETENKLDGYVRNMVEDEFSAFQRCLLQAENFSLIRTEKRDSLDNLPIESDEFNDMSSGDMLRYLEPNHLRLKKEFGKGTTPTYLAFEEEGPERKSFELVAPLISELNPKVVQSKENAGKDTFANHLTVLKEKQLEKTLDRIPAAQISKLEPIGFQLKKTVETGATADHLVFEAKERGRRLDEIFTLQSTPPDAKNIAMKMILANFPALDDKPKKKYEKEDWTLTRTESTDHDDVDVEKLKMEAAWLKTEIADRQREMRGYCESLRWNDEPHANSVQMKTGHLLFGHIGKVIALHWSLNSKRLVSVGLDSRVIEWNAKKGERVRFIPRYCNMTACAIAPSGNTVATCSERFCSIFSLESQKKGGIKEEGILLYGHEGFTTGCRFLDENHVLTCATDYKCALWDILNKQKICDFVSHEDAVQAIETSNDNHTFLSCSSDKTTKLWDVRCGSQCLTFSGHTRDVTSIAYYRNYLSFATGSEDATCRMYDLRSGEQLMVYEHADILIAPTVTSLDFGAKGRFLFSGCDDNNCYIWDTMKGNILGTMIGHDNKVSCLATSKDDKWIATGSWDAHVKLWTYYDIQPSDMPWVLTL